MAAGRTTDFDLGFPLGMFSATDYESIPRGGYVRSMNTVNRGRVVQCRPGYKWLFNMPAGNLQGMKLFRPSGGVDQLVFAVDGKVYYSLAPFEEFTQIQGIQFLAVSPHVYFETTEKAAERQVDNSIVLIDPKAVLVMQDGRTSPATWDGATGKHVKTIPLGTVMKWSGSRLWVGRNRLVFASDIYDPVSFIEGNYVGSIGAFILPGDITAMANTPSVDSPVLLCFTSSTTTLFQSNIRQRNLWTEVNEFEKTIFPNIGCVAHRSPVAHNGTLWWYCAAGLTTLDTAAAVNVTSAFRYVDAEMAVSKSRLAEDLTGICSASFENYLLVSVPHSDFFNRHTWVRDEYVDPTTGTQGGWNSYWTGTRPVEWSVGEIGGRSRVFHASVDRDGTNRMWEAFQSERLDNGCYITWTLETRGYNAQSLVNKQFRYSDIGMSEFSGITDIKVGWAGTSRGRYKTILEKRVKAMRGSLSQQLHLFADKDEFALKKQTRTLRSQEQRETTPDTLSACDVESENEDWLDTGFGLCIIANGPGAVRLVRMFMDEQNEKPSGKCEEDETNERGSRFDGGDAAEDTPADVLEMLRETEVTFIGNASMAMSFFDTNVVGSGQAETHISQQAADKMAECIANMRAAQLLKEQARPFLGGFLACQ